jgi:alkylation response protein AidB-like acyl-CoA dehydrogenase
VNFQHSEEQELLRDSVKTALARSGQGGAVAALAELGAFGVMVDEELGGSGLGMVEAAIIVQQAGKAGLTFPLSETVLLAGDVIADQPENTAATLAGKFPVAAAVSGSVSHLGRRLVGTLTFSESNDVDAFAAPLDDQSIALLSASIAGNGTRRAPIEPGEKAFALAVDVALQDARILTVAHYKDRLAVLRCAELLGAAEQCFELSIAYIKDREQFGQPIGANQALKHLAADNYLALENVRVAVEYAAAAMADALADPGNEQLTRDAETAVGVMLAYVPRAAREIAEASIQFHGGIGLTWEYTLNRYLRRIVRLGTALGSVTTHRRALAETICGERSERPALTATTREWRTA